MELQYLEQSDRFKLWDSKVEKARTDEAIELSLLFEVLREYVRTQRSICVRLNKASGTETQKNYPDVIMTTDDDSAFGMDMLVGIDESEIPATDDKPAVVIPSQEIIFAKVLFTRITDDTVLPEGNIIPDDLVMDGERVMSDGIAMKDPLSMDSKIRDSLVSVMRGWDRLSFAYTPYVMMITRLSSIGLERVHAEADPGQLTWTLTAVSGPYLVTTELNFGALVEWFKL